RWRGPSPTHGPSPSGRHTSCRGRPSSPLDTAGPGLLHALLIGTIARNRIRFPSKCFDSIRMAILIGRKLVGGGVGVGGGAGAGAGVGKGVGGDGWICGNPHWAKVRWRRRRCSRWPRCWANSLRSSVTIAHSPVLSWLLPFILFLFLVPLPCSNHSTT